ncbi:MAG: hypothetical protein IJ601_04565 [Acidaminococcaceae bacterium]|nr:hypothetical protein [Acidaminococcaceae bacterium]
MSDVEKLAEKLAVDYVRIKYAGTKIYLDNRTATDYAKSYKAFYQQILEELKKDS